MDAIQGSKLKAIGLDTTGYFMESERFKSIVNAMMRSNGFYTGHEYNPHMVKCYAVFNEYGFLALAIGSDGGEALENATDNDCMLSCLIDESDVDLDDSEDFTPLGNAGDLHDINNVSIVEVG